MIVAAVMCPLFYRPSDEALMVSKLNTVAQGTFAAVVLGFAYFGFQPPLRLI